METGHEEGRRAPLIGKGEGPHFHFGAFQPHRFLCVCFIKVLVKEGRVKWNF